MRKGRPSLTAHVMAAVRAGLTANGLLADPYAKLFVRPPIRMLSRIVRTPARSLPLLRELVGNVAARTILFDQQLCSALDDGIRQVVILGAGYDSRSYRLSRDNTHFIEVDNVDTQKLKRQRLLQAGVDISGVELLPIDFEKDSLATRLASLLDRSLPAFFLWEGVVEYLPEEAVRRTLRDLRSIAAPKSRLVFDLPHASSDCSPVIDFLSRTLSRALGEPKGMAMEPHHLDTLLHEEGWDMQSKLEIPELYDRYLRNVIRRAPTPHNYYVMAVSSSDRDNNAHTLRQQTSTDTDAA